MHNEQLIYIAMMKEAHLLQNSDCSPPTHESVQKFVFVNVPQLESSLTAPKKNFIQVSAWMQNSRYLEAFIVEFHLKIEF